MAPPPRRSGAEERTERRHRPHDSHGRHHDSHHRRRSPGSNRAPPASKTDPRSTQSARDRDDADSAAPPPPPRRRPRSPPLRAASPGVSLRGQAERRDVRLSRRDEPSPPPRKNHPRRSRSPSFHHRSSHRGRSRSPHRATYNTASAKAGRGEQRPELRDPSPSRRRRSPRRSRSPDTRPTQRRRSRSPASFARSRSPDGFRVARQSKWEGKPSRESEPRGRREGRSQAEDKGASSKGRRGKHHRRSPSLDAARPRRSRTPTRRRRSPSARRDNASDRALGHRSLPHHQQSQPRPDQRETPTRTIQASGTKDRPAYRDHRSRSRPRESAERSRQPTPSDSRRARREEEDPAMYPPPHRGGYYGPGPHHSRGYGPPPIDTRFSQSPPHPMAGSPNHPSPHGYPRGGYNPGYTQVARRRVFGSQANLRYRPSQGWSPHHTPAAYSPYDSRGYGPPQHGGPPPQNYYSPAAHAPYSNHSSPGPAGPSPRNYPNAPNQFGPSPSPHASSPTQIGPPQFQNHPNPTYSQRGGRGGGPRGGYPPRTGFSASPTQPFPQQQPAQTAQTPTQTRSGPHYANLTWKPGVGTRGGHAPTSLFQASQGQTSGPNGPVSDKTPTDAKEVTITENLIEESEPGNKVDAPPRKNDGGKGQTQGPFRASTKETSERATSPASKEPKISFKLGSSKPTQSLPPKPDLFQAKLAQANVQPTSTSRHAASSHEHHRDGKSGRYDDRKPDYPPRDRHHRDNREEYRSDHRGDHRADHRADYRDRPREPYPAFKHRNERPMPAAKYTPQPPLPMLVQNGVRSRWTPCSPIIPVKVTADTPVWLIRQLMDGMLRNHRQRPKNTPEEWLSKFPPKEFLPEQYKQAKSQYPKKDDSVVGAGTYGQVYKTINIYKPEQGHVALKRVAMASESSGNGFPFTSVRELSTLVAIKDLRMPKYIESMVERVFAPNSDKFDLWYYMVFEYVPFDLAGIINHPSLELELGHRKDLAIQMYEGLVWLHSVGVLHRDIKAGNILVDRNGVLKLTDFGLAKRFDLKKGPYGRHTNRIVTIWYRCPELLLGDVEYGIEPDYWAAACVLGEIMLENGAVLFPGPGTDVMQLDYMWSILGKPTVEEWPDMESKPWYSLLLLDKDYSKKMREAGGSEKRYQRKFEDRYTDKFTPAAMELLQSALQWDPKRRPDGKTVLSHRFFTEEEPKPKRFNNLGEVLGADFHEFDYKKHRDAARAERTEKHRQEREQKKREVDAVKHVAKRGADDMLANGERDSKKQKRDSVDGADEIIMVEASLEPGAPKEPGMDSAMPPTRPASGDAAPKQNGIGATTTAVNNEFQPSA